MVTIIMCKMILTTVLFFYRIYNRDSMENLNNRYILSYLLSYRGMDFHILTTLGKEIPVRKPLIEGSKLGYFHKLEPHFHW